MKIYICVTEENYPDSWSYSERPGSIEFEESDLPENYGVEFAERKWRVEGRALVSIQESPE